ncbi:MAG: metal-dependent hydrolase [Alphaproteobacteria bacterium]|nr:metal-dependent hydrolase [Alphaproteobacteria bacterium]
MKVQWLGHSGFRLETGKATILIDPFITGNPSASALDVKDVARDVSHIVLTHGHADHIGDTVEIARQTDATVIANYDLGMWLGHTGGLENLDLANTGGTLSHEGFSVTFVNAFHSSAQMIEGGVSHSLGSANGIVLHFADDPTLLHMGDTDIFSDMALINELHEPQIGIVPVGDRFTMGGAVAALACRRYFKFSTIIPCHYGTFPILDPSAEKFIAAMENDADKVKAPSVGEWLEF